MIDKAKEQTNNKFICLDIQNNQAQFHHIITSQLTPDQCKSIQNIISLANRRAAEKGIFLVI